VIAPLSRISLTALLVVSAAAELLVNRIGAHLVGRTSVVFPLVDRSGLFVLHFTGLLAAVLACWGIAVLLRDGRLLGVLGRTAVGIAALCFLPLATVGTIFRVSETLAAHASSAFALLLVTLVVALLSRPAALRHKLGVIYLAAPMLLHGYSYLTQQLPALAPHGDYADLPSRLFEAGEHMVVVGAYASFLFFSPAARWTSLLEPLPTAVAAVVAGCATILVQAAFPVAAQAAYYGLGLDLPSPMGSALHLAGLFFFALTVGRLLARPGPPRAMAYGLLLVALAGYQLRAAHQLLLCAIGVLLLVRAALAAAAEHEAPASADAAAARPLSADDWRRCLGALDAKDGISGETVVLENVSAQIVRWRGARATVPLSLRIAIRRGQPLELEVAAGRVPTDAPAVELTRPRSWLGSPGAALRFTVRDRPELADPLRAGALREDLERLIRGTLRIWPEEGVQYTARLAESTTAQLDGAGGATETLRELVLLVHRVAGAFAVRA
jgi:hypothetical protein